jgi:hypothetical protein
MRRPCLYLALVDPPSCHTHLHATLSFALAGYSINSCCTVLITLMPIDVQPPPPAFHLSLVLPGWLSRLLRLHLTLPLVVPLTLINVPAGCCIASRRAASALYQLSSHHPLLQHASWLSLSLSSCRPLVCACEGQPTIRWRRRLSKGRLTVSRHHHHYPLMHCCHCCHCMSRVSPMAPRCHHRPHVNKGWPMMPRRLVIIARVGGN